MKYWIINCFLVFQFITTTFLAHAQHVSEFDDYKARFPDKQAVMLSRRETVKLTLDKKDSINIILNYHSEMIHLGERTEGLAESSVSFSDFIEIKDLDAKTLVPNKSSYKQIKVTDFQVKTTSSSGIFFDDNKIKFFNYPGVQPGAKTELSYTQLYKEPHLLSPYYFSSYVPVITSELVLHVDKRIKLGFKLFNNNGSVKFSESEEGNFKVYKWKAENVSEYLLESSAPNISYHEPHLIYYIEEVNTKKKQEVLLKNTETLYNWYYSMAIKSQKPVGEELKALVDSLTQGADSPAEKTKRIFYWVQDHVKYVAFEEGYGGFIPRDANLVCDRRFGDCKDMANLLVQMLNTAGVPAYHTWIGTRDIPYSYLELPATNVDNHMIAAAKIDGKYYFLDATGRYTMLGLPSSMIQGKEALIGIDAEHFEIVKVPVVDASGNYVVDSSFCSIENNVLKGSGKLSLSGYNKIDFSYIYGYAKKENKKEVVKEYCTKGSNKFTLKDYKHEGIDDKESPVDISYDFELEDYIKSNGNEVYINLNLDRSHDKSKIDTTKRKLPFEYDYKYTQEDVISLQIPKGYKVEYLPSNVKMSNEFFDFEINYKLDKASNKIIYSKKAVLNTLLLEKKDFSEWNKVANQISQAYREVIVLKQN